MWGLTIRNLLARKARVAMTALAVLLGVAFIGATQILGATVRESLTASAGNFYENLAVDVRGESTGDFGERGSVPAALADRIAELDGVTSVVGLQLEPVTLVGSDGKVLSAPVTAGTWFDDPVQPLKVVQGRAPEAPTEAVLTESLAEQSGLGIGDELTFESGVGPATATVTGLVAAESSSVAGVPALVLAPGQDAKLQTEGEVTELAVVGDGVEVTEVASLAEAAGAGLEVRSGQAAADDAVDAAESQAQALTIAFTAFGALSLFVGVFIIYNTFNILMAQRRREMALLRAIGVRRKQVVRSVLGEAAVIGLVAGIVGAGLGVVIAALGRSVLLGDIDGALVVEPSGLVSGVLLGLVATTVSAWLPARRAAKVAPVEALRESATDSSGQSRVRVAVGVVLAALSGLLLAGGLRPDADSAGLLIGVSAFVGLIAVIVLSPLLARLLVPIFGAPVRLLRGQIGRLATENARRQPQRTAATATALLIGVAIIGFALVLAASIKASVSTALEDRVHAEYVVSPVSFGTPLSPGAIAAAEEAAGTTPTSLSWTVPASVDGSDQALVALDTATGGDLWDLQPEGAALADLGPDGILVDRHAAEDRGLALGDQVEVAFIGGTEEEYVVRAIGESRPFGSDFVIDSGNLTERAPVASASMLLVGDGVSRDRLDAALVDFPNADVSSPAEMADELSSVVDLLLQVLFGFLGLSVVIAFIGVANTMALSIHERTRELGILRAIALRRSHVRSAVRWEAAIIAALGTALGIAFGAGFGVALAVVLEDTGFSRLDVPWLQLLAVVVGASLAGALAATMPARRAAKLNVLDAIHQL